MENGELVSKGNVTECGMINYLLKQGAPVKETLDRRESENLIEFSIPFSSSRKRATTAVKEGEDIRVFCKGAPEILIELCD